jgi:2Fe-2S ferredoxin
MPTIYLKKNRPQINTTSKDHLMKILMDAGIPVASSCGGDGVCGKCKVQIIDGINNLSTENETEKILRERLSIDQTQRISCQCHVLGDITIDTSYW